MSSATPSATGPPADGEEPPAAPELPTPFRTWTGLDRIGLDRLGLTQAIGGLALGLITLFSSYDHITISGRTFPIPQQWGITFIVASVAIFFLGACNTARHLGATLNWRRDPGYEQRKIQYEQSKLQHEWRMKRIAERTKQIESDILLVESEIAQLRSEREQIESDNEQIESDSEQIEKETEQLRRETTREKALSASIRRLCFPPESSSTPQTPTEPSSKPSCPPESSPRPGS